MTKQKSVEQAEEIQLTPEQWDALDEADKSRPMKSGKDLPVIDDQDSLVFVREMTRQMKERREKREKDAAS